MNVIRSALRPVKGRMRVLRAVRCMCWGLMAGRRCARRSC